jgi:hypothetical protein
MERGSPFSQVCSCGKECTTPGSLRNHQKTCKKSKKRLSNALAKAKELIATRKQNEDPPEPIAVHENVSTGEDQDSEQNLVAEVAEVIHPPSHNPN